MKVRRLFVLVAVPSDAFAFLNSYTTHSPPLRSVASRFKRSSFSASTTRVYPNYSTSASSIARRRTSYYCCQQRGFIGTAYMSQKGSTSVEGHTCSREEFNERQRQAFSGEERARFFSDVPEDVVPKLAAIARATGLPADGVVVDVGTGTGCLIPYFVKERGVSPSQVVGVDLSQSMIDVFNEEHPEATGVVGDFLDWTPEEPVDCVVYNACFGNLYSQADHLKHTADVLKVGGTVVISHPLGAKFVSRLKKAEEDMVPHDLPTEEQLKDMIQFLPLEVSTMTDEEDFYLAVLKRIGHRLLEKCIYLKGEVSSGYGRGSKKIGVPTANLPESLFADSLKDMQTGVYVGWGMVEGEGSLPSNGPYKMVVNIGYSPTFAGQENPEKIVEAHLIDYDGGDFYGKQLRLLILGFKRKERKFNSFPELVSTINQDVSDAREALGHPPFVAFKKDAFFDVDAGMDKGGSTTLWREEPVVEVAARLDSSSQEVAQ